MLSKDRIISTALLKLGEVNAYNDNKSDIYNIANKLLENVIDTIASRNDFLFNSTTVKLTNVGKNGTTEENIFNVPVDFLNKISFMNGEARIENEFIYSNNDEVVIQYCRKINFNEIPDYLFNYMVYSLATEIAETYAQYIDRLGVLNQRLEQERQILYRIEYSAKTRKI